MRPKNTFIHSVILYVLLFFSNRVFADGCFFYEVEQIGNSAESPNQRALIIYDGEKETLVLQVKYSGEVEKFAWVVPLPNLPEANTITTEDDTIFEEIHDETQPKVYRIFDRYGKGYYLGGGGGEGDSELIPEVAVQVWERLQVGPYEVAVLSGASSQALIDWLATNGYDFPGEAHAIIDFYIQKHWYFVATRVHVASTLDKNNSSYQAGLPALKMQFQTDKPVFPLRISELTSANENEIELYVAAPHRMVCESYHTVAMEQEEVQRLIEKQIDENNANSSTGIACACDQATEPAQNETEYDYEAIFQDKIASFTKPTFIVEHATMQWTSYNPIEYPDHGSFNGYFNEYFSPGEEFWLTRLRTILTPSDMQEDVTFIPDTNGDEWFYLWIHIEDKISNPWSATLFNLSGIILLPFFALKKFRRRQWKELLMAILAITIATI